MSFATSALTLALSLQVAAPTGAFHPDETALPPGGPEIAIFRSVASDVVSLRFSVPMEESFAEAGAGQFIQVQAQERMEPLASRIGARSEVHRTPQALVYQVTGALADLDFLGWILREGLLPPAPLDFDDARRFVETENERRVETPRGVLAARLRAALAPTHPSIFGNVGSLSRVDPVRLRALWERTHTLANARLVVAGRVATELILALVSDLGLDPPDIPTQVAPAEITGSPAPTPQVLRHWIAEGYPLSGETEAAAFVAARWLAETVLADDSRIELGVEIWDTGQRSRALVVTGAAYPDGLANLRSRFAGLLSDAAASITEADVTRISGDLHADILMSARTPWGLAEVVGQAWDTGDSPAGIERLVLDLAALDRAAVAGLLETLDRSNPVREELNP